MKKAMVSLSIQMLVDCPHCGKSIDLADPEINEEGVYTLPIFYNKWDTLNDEDVDCPHCYAVFHIDHVEW